MKKAGYKILSLIAVSIMAAIPMIASAASFTPSKPAKARVGLHFDIGAQLNTGYSSIRYIDARYVVDSTSGLTELLENVPIEVHQGPMFSPTLFLGLRYYMNKSYVGFHIGNTFTHRKLLSLSYDDYFSDAQNRIKSKLTDRNTLYGKLSWGYFITPKTDLNIGVLGAYDCYRLSYEVKGINPSDSNDFAFLLHHKNLTGSGYGMSLGIEHYISDHIIFTLNYTFMQHNSKNVILKPARFEGPSPTVEDNSASHINFGDMHENIVSLGIIFEM